MLICISRLTEKFSSTKQITFYPDSCRGQNRNQFVASALFYSLCINPKIEIRNYLKQGTQRWSQTPCTVIERAEKYTSILVPSQWSTVRSMTRKYDPYVVIP